MDLFRGRVAPLGQEQQLRIGVVTEVRRHALVDPAARDVGQLWKEPRPDLAGPVLEVRVQGSLRHCEHDGVHPALTQGQRNHVALADDRVEIGLRRDVAGRELEDALLVEGRREVLAGQVVPVADDVWELDPQVGALGQRPHDEDRFRRPGRARLG